MGSEQQPLRNVGIYRNLPTFDPSLKGLKAIVVGATGISGFNTMRSLLESPDRWSTIYALSRSPPTKEMLSLLSPDQASRIKHVSLDLTGSAEKTAQTLKSANVTAQYIFFYGYMNPPNNSSSAMDPSMARDLIKTNVPIFANFLAALPLANLQPKRILLQTGGKHYGGHIGRARLPYVESDPRPTHLEDNFYYHQMDLLQKYCTEHPETSWNELRPFGVIGAAPAGGMNFFVAFAAHAAVCAERAEPMFCAGDIDEWQYEYVHSSARLSGFLAEWAVLEDKCANQAFNAQDGCAVSWDRVFEELGRWYGVEKGVTGPEPDASKYQTRYLAGGKECPLGYGPPPGTVLSRSYAAWAKEAGKHEAWKTIMAREGVSVDHFESDEKCDDVFGGGDFVFYKIGQASAAKGRRFGWCGFVDTVESLFEACGDMAVLGLLPKTKVEAARAMV